MAASGPVALAPAFRLTHTAVNSFKGSADNDPSYIMGLASPAAAAAAVPIPTGPDPQTLRRLETLESELAAAEQREQQAAAAEATAQKRCGDEVMAAKVGKDAVVADMYASSRDSFVRACLSGLSLLTSRRLTNLLRAAACCRLLLCMAAESAQWLRCARRSRSTVWRSQRTRKQNATGAVSRPLSRSNIR